MNRLFHHLLDKYVVVYLDDILVFSKSIDEHKRHLRTVLDILRKHSWRVKLKKSFFFQTELRYLGHIISQDGLRVDPDKVSVIKDMRPPRTIKEV